MRPFSLLIPCLALLCPAPAFAVKFIVDTTGDTTRLPRWDDTYNPNTDEAKQQRYDSVKKDLLEKNAEENTPPEKPLTAEDIDALVDKKLAEKSGKKPAPVKEKEEPSPFGPVGGFGEVGGLGKIGGASDDADIANKITLP